MPTPGSRHVDLCLPVLSEHSFGRSPVRNPEAYDSLIVAYRNGSPVRLKAGGAAASSPDRWAVTTPRVISGEQAVWLQHRIGESDFTLRGLVAELAERGLKVDYRSVWEFVHAEKLSFKKACLT
jgi:hypothetical protein